MSTQVKLSDYYKSLTKEELSYFTNAIKLLESMRDQREQPYKEFDNMTYTQRYEVQRNTDMAYNDLQGDIDERDKGFSLTTGVTRHKDTTVLSHLMSMQFDPNIEARDDENVLHIELGENVESLVKISRDYEMYDLKRNSIYRELISQGDVFVEEQFVEYMEYVKDCKAEDGRHWSPGMKIESYKGDDKPIIKTYSQCEVKLIPGKYVYLGTITEQNIRKQNIVATYIEQSFEDVKRVFGGWDRWQYVELATDPNNCRDELSQQFNTGVAVTNSGLGSYGADYFWSMKKPGKGNIGIVKVYCPFSNEFMIFLNGIMMLPVGFPLTKISPSGHVPIANAGAERIPNFAYSKGIPSNTYVDEKLYDYVYQSMMKKMMQSAEPTLANRTGLVLPRNFMKPGKTLTGVSAKGLEAFLPAETRTITQSDNLFFQTAREILNTKTVDDAFSSGGNDKSTATQFLEEKKNTIAKLFQMVDAVAHLERQLVELRIANIVTHWSKPEVAPVYEDVEKIVDGVKKSTKEIKEKKKYRTEIVKTQLKRENKEGIRIINFYGEDEKLPTLREQQKKEDQLEKEYGTPVRITYLSAPEFMRTLNWYWSIKIVPRSEDATKLEVLSYIDNKTRIAKVFGIESLNRDYTLQRIATMMNEDYEKAYVPTNMNTQKEMLQKTVSTEKNPLQNVINSGMPSLGNQPQ